MAKNKDNGEASAALVGCAVLGVGLGLAFDNVAAGSVIGAGVGFLIMAMLRSRK